MALVLVTGGAGFLGSHLVRALADRGERVRVLDDLSTGRWENLQEGPHRTGPPGSGAPVELLEGDVRDPAACRAACRGARAVLHEAALVSVPRSLLEPDLCYEVNVTGTLRVLEAARAEGVGRVVLAASSAAYGDAPELQKRETMPPRPLSPYASSKLAAEQLLEVWGRVHGLATVSLRYFNVFGPRQRDDSPYTGVIALFCRALLAGEPVQIHGDGLQTRDFTYVENAVRANLLALEADVEPGLVVNVGGGERISLLQLLGVLRELCGVDGRAVHGPPRAGDVRDSLASLERARAVLGYEPVVGWREGLARTVAWYRERSLAG